MIIKCDIYLIGSYFSTDDRTMHGINNVLCRCLTTSGCKMQVTVTLRGLLLFIPVAAVCLTTQNMQPSHTPNFKQTQAERAHSESAFMRTDDKEHKGEDILEPSISFCIHPSDLPVPTPATSPLHSSHSLRDKRELLIKTNHEDQSLLLRAEVGPS
jgi:hypothetical protein